MHFGYNYKAIEGVGPRPPDGKLLIFSAACPVLDRRKKQTKTCSGQTQTQRVIWLNIQGNQI